MIPEDQFPVGRPRPRVDSFEVVEPDGPELTAEEAAWPVAAVVARADGFTSVPPTEAEVVIRLRGDTSDVAAVIDRLQAAIKDAAAATGGRIDIEFALPDIVRG